MSLWVCGGQENVGCAFKAPYATLVGVNTMPGSADCGEVT